MAAQEYKIIKLPAGTSSSPEPETITVASEDISIPYLQGLVGTLGDLLVLKAYHADIADGTLLVILDGSQQKRPQNLLVGPYLLGNPATAPPPPVFGTALILPVAAFLRSSKIHAHLERQRLLLQRDKKNKTPPPKFRAPSLHRRHHAEKIQQIQE